jgi:tryptophanyl-tRNA synthetase
MTTQRVFSGVQPTGNLHLGNYLGAIKNWVRMQDEMECIFGIMNLHASTVPQDPTALRQSTREVTAALIASGIDPNKSIIFAQSTVSAHAELAWILNCHTPLGWLNRMTQFKEKAGNQKDNAVLGLYAYPVLMAADILAYKATHVPVGEDQKQHLELARDIAGAFNRFVGEDFFPLPEPKIMPQAARIMSLNDGTRKMSKSEESDYSRINLTDDTDAIANKFKKAQTDSDPSLTFDKENRPSVANLITIYAALAETTPEHVVEQFSALKTGQFKAQLADLAVAKLSPITQRMRELMKDEAELDALLARGKENAAAIAEPILKQTMEKIGLLAS